MTRPTYTPPIASYRARGECYLRLARDLARPRRIGRPRAGERADHIHDRGKELRRALREAREWFTMASRYVLHSKVPRPVPVKIDVGRAPMRGG